jgi:hypothetical protein
MTKKVSGKGLEGGRAILLINHFHGKWRQDMRWFKLVQILVL